MKYLIKFWKQSNKYLLLGLLIPIITVIGFFLSGNPKPILSPNLNILYTDSLFVNNSNLTMHNQNIFQLLQQREATADQLYSLDSQDSRQLRNIYIAIMAVFLPLIFVKRSKNSNEQVKRTAQLAILILIPSLLYLNADSDDNLKRSYEKVQIMHISLDTLANSKHMKNTWYGLDYSLIDQQLSNVPHPLLRKFQRASNPNPETVLFYWVPWIIIYLISCKKSEAFAG